jgi:hemoglobin
LILDLTIAEGWQMRRLAVVIVATAVLAGCGGGSSPEAAAPAPAPSAGPSLYERLGGQGAITAVVDTFVANVAADTRINAFFHGVDMPQLKRLLVEQICQATGGPCTYTGRSMRAAHTGMNITNAQFDALVQDLVRALDTFRVPEREKTELLTALGGMRREIVGQ